MPDDCVDTARHRQLQLKIVEDIQGLWMLTEGLVAKWRQLIAEDPRSIAEICRAINKDRSWYNTLKPGRDPGAFTVMALARELRVPIHELLEEEGAISLSSDSCYSEQVNQQASKVLSDVFRVAHNRLQKYGHEATAASNSTLPLLLQWWHDQRGCLIGHDMLADRFDIIKAPETGDKIVTPAKVGARSLAAQMLGTDSADALLQLVRTFDRESQERLISSYREVSDSGRPALSAPISARITTPHDAKSIHVEYFRLQLPVVAPSGDKFVLSYCFPV
ncbi:hypothetical protein [Tritonibacter scottomollicae]|nr:hypothetical protein [Tritonibacter scottomollicae]